MDQICAIPMFCPSCLEGIFSKEWNHIIFVPLFLNCIMYSISKLRSFERCNFVNFFFEIFQPLTRFPLSFTSTSSILTTSNCSRLRGCSGSLMFLIKSKISRASTGSGMESSQSESVTERWKKHLNFHVSKRKTPKYLWSRLHIVKKPSYLSHTYY